MPICARSSRGIFWLLAGFALLWALAPLALALMNVHRHGGVISGADGGTAASDQLQYMAWLRDSGLHSLISNQFDLAPAQHDYLHPMFWVSGVLWRLGLSVQLAYLVWKPIAVVVLVTGFSAFAAATGISRGRQAAAVLVGLFYLTPLLPLLYWAGTLRFGRFHLFTALLGAAEMSPAWLLWGYAPAAIAVGLLPLWLLAIRRGLESGRFGPWLWASLIGLVISWLHPWQGLTLLLVLLCLLFTHRRAGVARRLLLVAGLARRQSSTTPS